MRRLPGGETALGNDYQRCSIDYAAGRLLASAAENELFWRLLLAEFHQQPPSNLADQQRGVSGRRAAGFVDQPISSARLAAYRLPGDDRKAPVEQWSAVPWDLK